MAAIAQRGADVSNGLSSASSRLHSTVVCQNSSRGWTKGARRAAVGGNVPRTRSIGRPTRGAQNPNRPHAREPGAPATTRPAPPPIEASAIRPPRSLALGGALATMGRLARSASHHSPRDGHRLASAGLSRLLDLEISAQALGSSVRRSGACPTRPHHGARKYSLGCAAHPWRTAQAWVRRLTTDGRTSDAAPPEATLADLAHFSPEPRRRPRRRRLLRRADRDVPNPLRVRGSAAPPSPSRALQRHRDTDGSLDCAADR